MNNCGCKRPAVGPEPHAPVPLHGGGFVPNAIEWLKKKIDKLFGTAVFTVNGHEPEGGNVDVIVPSKVSELENDAGYLTEHQDVSGIAATAEEALSVATDAAENSVRIVNGKAPTAGSVKIVLDDLADKDGNIETTKNIMVSRDGGESHVAVALYSDLISEIDIHNNDVRAHTKLMATVARDYATKTEVDAKADKSALQAEVERAQAAETQLTTKAENAQSAANAAQSAANVAQSSANAAQSAASVAGEKADAVYAELANKLDKSAVVAPSASATAGQAADAAKVGEALAMKAPSNITTASDDKIRIVYGDNVWWITPLGIYYWNDGEAGEHAHSPTAVFALPTSVYSSSFALISDIEDAVKNKVGSFESVGGASATITNGIANLYDFFTESNGLLTGTIDAEIVEKGTAPDAHLEAPTDEHLKLILADNSVAYDSAKALPYKLTSVIGDRVIATMTLTAASTDITLPTIAANDTTVKDFILDVTNAYAVEGVATDAGINIPRTDFKLVTRDGESLTDVTTVKAGKSAFICFTQKSPVVVDGTTYPCWCVIQLPFGDPS